MGPPPHHAARAHLAHPKRPAFRRGGAAFGRARRVLQLGAGPPVFSDIFEFFNFIGADPEAQDLTFLVHTDVEPQAPASRRGGAASSRARPSSPTRRRTPTFSDIFEFFNFIGVDPGRRTPESAPGRLLG
jgi:hypothetical protein